MAYRSDLTDLLRGYTALLSLEFSFDIDGGVCNLILALAESELRGAKAIRAEFHGVADLSIKGFGGGLTQLLLLVVEDIGYRQLDRINYEVKERERESISFLCQRVTMGDIQNE